MNYVVKNSDTLQSIAKEIFGDEGMSNYLASINNIPAVPGVAGGWAYVISPGQTLIVDTAEVEAKSQTYFWPVIFIGAFIAFCILLWALNRYA